MSKTVLSNPGAIGVSFAGVTDKYKIVANVIMLAERLFKFKATIKMIEDSLTYHGLESSPENIAKVKAFFKPDHDWGGGRKEG